MVEEIIKKAKNAEVLSREECQVLADHLKSSEDHATTMNIYTQMSKCRLTMLRIHPLISPHILSIYNKPEVQNCFQTSLKTATPPIPRCTRNLVPGESYLSTDTVALNYGDMKKGNNGWHPIPKGEIITCIKSNITLRGWDKGVTFCLVSYTGFGELYFENTDKNHDALILI